MAPGFLVFLFLLYVVRLGCPFITQFRPSASSTYFVESITSSTPTCMFRHNEHRTSEFSFVWSIRDFEVYITGIYKLLGCNSGSNR
ncbi:hypothetical protein EDD15DRAFT_2284677 [Pisolithus albus]|nr:hypothetical protein EDD15DRAFT_2284677 [Pisolithus albus]